MWFLPEGLFFLTLLLTYCMFLICADSEFSRAKSSLFVACTFYCQSVSQATPRIPKFYHLTDELSKIIPISNVSYIDKYNYYYACESILLSSMSPKSWCPVDPKKPPWSPQSPWEWSGTHSTSFPDYIKIASTVSY